MGYLAQYVLDKRIPLEICLSSNVHTGAAESLETPSLRHLLSLQVPRHAEYRRSADERHDDDEGIRRGARVFGLDIDDFEKITINSMKSAFIPY